MCACVCVYACVCVCTSLCFMCIGSYLTLTTTGDSGVQGGSAAGTKSHCQEAGKQLSIHSAASLNHFSLCHVWLVVSRHKSCLRTSTCLIISYSRKAHSGVSVPPPLLPSSPPLLPRHGRSLVMQRRTTLRDQTRPPLSELMKSTSHSPPTKRSSYIHCYNTDPALVLYIVQYCVHHPV